MDIKQKYREEKNKEPYCHTKTGQFVKGGSYSDDYVKWLEEQLNKADVSRRLLRELRQTYLVDLDNEGQPKASIIQIMDLWDRVNKELQIVTID